MVHIINTVPVFKKKSPAAFRGPLNCPLCNADGKKKSRWEYIENITPFRIRYRCKDCGCYVQYDFSKISHLLEKHPYEPFKRSKWQDIVGRWKAIKRPA